jgi:hypothetical protein
MDPISARKSFIFLPSSQQNVNCAFTASTQDDKKTFEYLCEFYFIFETNLGYKTGDQMCSFNEKNRDKIS